MSSLLRLERQLKRFLKIHSNSSISFSFLFIWNWNDKYVHGLSLYPFSDQNDANANPVVEHIPIWTIWLIQGISPLGGGGGVGQWDHFKCKFLISTCQCTTYHPSPQTTHPAPPPKKNILVSSGFLSQSCYYLFQIDDCICIASWRYI